MNYGPITQSSINAHPIFFLAVALLGLSCCCPPDPPQPVRPDSVDGWKYFDIRRKGSEAEFVLNKGESTDNGQIGVEVLDVLPPLDKCDVNGYGHFPRVNLRLFNPANREVLCEDTWIGSGLDSECFRKVPLETLRLLGINYKERWVHFKLESPLSEDKVRRYLSAQPPAEFPQP
jgi:hypothetical protein